MSNLDTLRRFYETASRTHFNTMLSSLMNRRCVSGEDRGGSPVAVASIVIGFALVHSLLASHTAKDAAVRLLGRRARNGLYRFAFIAQAILTTGLAIWSFLRLPDRTLYRLPRPWSGVMVGIQLVSLLLLASAIHVVGFRRIMGLPQLTGFLRGEVPDPEPEAQGPPLTTSGDQMDARGPFRFIRHPDNLPIITLLWSFPRMTINRLTLAALASIYAAIGSCLEDVRLRRAYGESFEAYARKTPMLLPCWKR